MYNEVTIYIYYNRYDHRIVTYHCVLLRRTVASTKSVSLSFSPENLYPHLEL